MPEYKSFEEIQEDIDNDKNPVVNDVWNAAIEAAARCAELNIDDCEIHNLIRKLRK